MYAFEAGSRAIMAHYERMGIPAERVEKGVDYGIYHTTYKIKGEPLTPLLFQIRITARSGCVCPVYFREVYYPEPGIYHCGK